MSGKLYFGIVLMLFASSVLPVFALDMWVPVVPLGDYVSLSYWKEGDSSFVNVSIEFWSSGYNVSDCGFPIIAGENISVNAEIWRWTGVVAPLTWTWKHTYDLGSLPAGRYTFTFSCWGEPVKDVTFAVGAITVPDDFSTIQEAINNAIDEDTIFVRAGIYYENVIINKKVSLVGEDKVTTIIDGGGRGNVVYMTSTADVANISSFTLRNGRGINDGAGIAVQSSGNHTIAFNIITNNQRGLRLQLSRYDVICSNEITSNSETGIELRTSHWNSISNNTVSRNGLNIWIIGSGINTIVDNEVREGGWGISLDGSFNNTLRSNNMNQNGFNLAVSGMRIQDYIHDIDVSNLVNGRAVYYLLGKKNLVIDNSVHPEVGYIGIVNCENMTVRNLNLEANAEGIKLVNTTGSLIENLRINGVSAGIGIEFGSCNNTVSKNVVLWSEMVGIYLYDSSSYNVIYENQLTCLNSGIRALDSSDHNLIYHNTFFQYFPQQMSFNSTNTWDNGCEGNYWSDYNGTDSDGDGVGNSPYVIDSSNQDSYPLMAPYMFGDVTHDGQIDIRDIAKIAGIFLSTPADPNWNPHCDVNGDNVIDIVDLVAVAANFGVEWMPP